MITVRAQYIRSAKSAPDKAPRDSRPSEVISLPLLEPQSPVSQVLASDAVRTWLRRQTGMEFARMTPSRTTAQYKPIYDHGTDTYILWIRNGSTKKLYKEATSMIRTNIVELQLQMKYGKGQRPTADASRS
jgi:hypothetical protein